MARDGSPERSSDQPALFDDDMVTFRAVLGVDLPVAAAVDALTRCSGDTERAIKWLQDNVAAAAGVTELDGGEVEAEKGPSGGAAPVPAPRGVKTEYGVGGGAAAHSSRPSPPLKVEAAGVVKMEPIDAEPDEVKVKAEDPSEVEVKVEACGEADVKVKTELIEDGGSFQEEAVHLVKQEEADDVDVKEEDEEVDSPVKEHLLSPRRVKEEESDSSDDEVEVMDPPARSKKRPREDDDGVVFIDLTTSHPVPYLNPKPVRALPPPGAIPKNEWRMVVAPPPAELDEYPPDRREWCFFKKSYATGLSTCRGRKLLDGGEVVHFAFPSHERLGGIRMSYRQEVALMQIVRFSTNRSGEVRSCNF
jgi:DNA repair protein RAD5